MTRLILVLDPSDDPETLPGGEWTKGFLQRGLEVLGASGGDADLGVAFEIYRVALDEWPSQETLERSAALLVCGSYRSVYEEDSLSWIGKLIALLQTHLHARPLPFLGICYGGQLLARAVYGKGAVRPMTELDNKPEFGYKQVRLRPELNGPEALQLFQGFPETWVTVSMHFDGFAHPDLVPLVSSKQWSNHAFYVSPALLGGNSKVWGLQFHPEMTESVANTLFDRRRRAQADLVQHERSTADWDLTGQLAANFLRVVLGLGSPKKDSRPFSGHRSIHSAGVGEVHLMPMAVITRPLASQVDENKVNSLIETLQQEEKQGIAGTRESAVPPIDVLWVEAESEAGGDKRNYYFSFGGCHRYEAHRRLGSSHIAAKLIKTDASVIRAHVGLSLNLLPTTTTTTTNSTSTATAPPSS
jgi:sulfiredoxin